METSTVKYFFKVRMAVHLTAKPETIKIRPISEKRRYLTAIKPTPFTPIRIPPETEMRMVIHKILKENLSRSTNSVFLECLIPARTTSDTSQMRETKRANRFRGIFLVARLKKILL